jgi:hypothetical protein
MQVPIVFEDQVAKVHQLASHASWSSELAMSPASWCEMSPYARVIL